MLSATATGFFTALSLILAIGAQNAFVLRQGLMRAHVFWLCLLCAVSDAVLIAAGVVGFAGLERVFPGFPMIMAIAGAAFLFVYGLLRFRAAIQGDYELVLSGRSAGLAATLATGLAITWLNPHVYLDTLGLIGAVSVQYADLTEKTAFGIAAATASFTFFFSLGYGARLLSPIMQSALAWKRLDFAIGVVMWTIAAGLLRSVL